MSRIAYLLDDGSTDGVTEIDMEEFLADNEDLSQDEQHELLELQPGQVFMGGGGATPVWSVRCVLELE